MNAHSITSVAVALLAGVPISRVRLWRRDVRHPRPEHVAAMVKELGIPIEIFHDAVELPATEIGEVMLQREMTDHAVAARLNVTSAAVASWRRGAVLPNIVNCRGLANVLCMPLSSIRPDIWTPRNKRKAAPNSCAPPPAEPIEQDSRAA